MTLTGYEELNLYYGDLHSHCQEVGYGYGSVEEAYQNARTQLDFASVTAHAVWPDLPEQDDRLARLVAYHQDGFRRAAAGWLSLQEVTEAVNEPGQFVAFPSFEWHSLRYGDHNVYFKESGGHIIHAADLTELRAELRQLKRQGVAGFLIPHHIGYLSGYRGINWPDFTAEFSPVVEICSMHGVSESNEAPYPYLHTMGPRDGRSTLQYGLKMGNICGVIGSTDHHSAFPGSYGYGRLAVWAKDLSRAGIWEAIAARRTYALTGDRIELAVALNGQPMGSVQPDLPERTIDVSVRGGAPLDYVEILHNNQAIHRWSANERAPQRRSESVKVFLELGWGTKSELVDWQVELDVIGGKLLSVEPRLRGREIVSPQTGGPEFSPVNTWQPLGEQRLRLNTQTWGNPTIVTPATQGICLEILGGEGTQLSGRINDQTVQVALKALKYGSRTGYLAGFRSPAYCFHRAVPESEYRCNINLVHRAHRPSRDWYRDWYYVRVCQKNGQWAWSSPIWVEAKQV